MPSHATPGNGGQTTIGARLRDVRKRRGMTQQELAAESGVSLSLIRKLEQGEVSDTRVETARRLAAAMRVPTSQLLAGHTESGADGGTLDRWAPVRRALAARSDGVDEAPTVAGVRSALDAALPLFSGDRLDELSTILPAMLRDADALDTEGRAVRARLLQLTGWLLTQTRQFDAAHDALQRSLDDSTDQLEAATTASTQCWLLLRRGQVAQARDYAVHWADEVEPRISRATPDELSVWGWLLLRASAAAVRDNRPGEADDALRLAHSAAVATGREFTPAGDFLRAFGPVTVTLKRAENAIITDRPDRVLALAARIPAGALRPTSNNWNRHRLDVAKAHVLRRQYGEAVAVLSGLLDAAPQWLPHQRYARDIMGEVITRRRTLTAEMRHVADAVGVPL